MGIKSPHEVRMRSPGARFFRTILFFPLLAGSWLVSASLRAESSTPVFRCDFSGDPKADPCQGPWSSSEDRVPYAPLDQIILKAAWNEGLKLSFDIVVSGKNPREQLAIAQAAEAAGARRICIAEGGSSFRTETFDYLGCRQGIDLESGEGTREPEGDLYLDGVRSPYLTSPMLYAPNGIHALSSRPASWSDRLDFKPSERAASYLVRSASGKVFRVEVVDYTPSAALERGVYAVVGLTFRYVPEN